MSRTLAAAVWVDIPERPLVLVPLGSTEQHGPHLPLATDTLIADAVATTVANGYEAAGRGRAVVAPVLGYGASGEHQGFPGTVSLGHDALRELLVEMIRSLSHWAGSIVFVNGHGGNLATLNSVIEQMTYEGHHVSMVMCALESAKDAHAGHDETSVLLHIHPELVDMSRAEAGNTAPIKELLPDLTERGVRPVSANGILGDPTTATATAGAQMFAGLVDRVLAQVSDG